MNHLAEQISIIARHAGDEIMAIYQQDFSVYEKSDNSPLTLADLAAHQCIVRMLTELDGNTPILSEESADIDWAVRQQWTRYWLVDPLDGTREFVKKNGEFTVNIALIENGEPVLGVVYVPVIDWLLVGGRGIGAQWTKENQSGQAKITPAANTLRVAASRSHRDEKTQAYLDKIGSVDTVGLGSSLKFCKIATGELDLYPRFGLTSEWDTAAAQAVLEAAGGGVFTLDGVPLRYNHKDSLLNPHFIAVGDLSIPWKTWL
ncbi:MAG TPA: 3'(2'),5'-bisphosphate nucleotidase CysQ [Arenimonas sp.]|nr:3'(2'),5'-bisphosphate nucleotidase CysQ [Arenimonas sp.]